MTTKDFIWFCIGFAGFSNLLAIVKHPDTVANWTVLVYLGLMAYAFNVFLKEQKDD